MSILSALGDNPPGVSRTVMAEMPVVLQSSNRGDRAKLKSPQQKVDEFWRRFSTEVPGKATTVIPQSKTTSKIAQGSTNVKSANGSTARSYEEAAELCKAKVEKIVKECRRINQKYRDPHFDLEFDLKMGQNNCLTGLDNEKPEESSSDESATDDKRRQRRRGKGKKGGRRGSVPSDREEKVRLGADMEQADGTGKAKEEQRPKGVGMWRRDGVLSGSFRPRAVKRVTEIFDDPKFYIDGPTANDVRQGRDGDCWLMAALCTLSNKSGLIERICVARDEAVGVYGFVFHRDGEWISEIIDDKLYLTKPDYDEVHFERIMWDDRERINTEEIYRKTYQSNSGALYFAQCENPNETWLPLLEKAYAKAHGDYAAIEGGFTGEGIEDLTGGVTSELFTTDILDKEYFWNKELMRVNTQFLFGCSTGVWGNGWGDRVGIVELHAYSVMRAVEMDGQRLVLLKNPWGKGEWKGAWSDGSKEWTPEWLNKLDHRFGDDGAFWISYDDLLRKYQAFDRTRLFGPDWKVASTWTTLSVPWTLEYHDTKFSFTLFKPGPVVMVLSQLDDRYFRGLEGQYRFELSFRLHAAGEEDYIVRSQTTYRMNRSVNVELELEPGEYHVLVKIDATRDNTVMPAEDVVKANAKDRREKLIRIGLAYDVAHSKGKVIESPEEKAARQAYEKRKREKEKKEFKEKIMKERMRDHHIQCKRLARSRKRMEKNKVKQKAREEKAKAEHEKIMAERGPPAPAGHRKHKGKKVGKKDAQVQTDDQPHAETVKQQQVGNGVQATHKDEQQRDSTDSKDAKDDTTKDGDSSVQGENTPSATSSEKTSDDTTQPDTKEPESKSETEDKPGVLEVKFGGSHTETVALEEEEPVTATDPTEPTTAQAQPPPPAALPQEDTFHTAQQGNNNSVDDTSVYDSASDSEFSVSHRPHRPPPTHRPRRPFFPGPPQISTPGLRPYSHPPPPPPPGAFIPRRGGPVGSGYLSDDSLSSLSSPSEVTDRELEYYLEDNKMAAARRSLLPPPAPPVVVGGEEEEGEKDPWNAVAVVGLRVYYRVDADAMKAGDEEVVQVKVIRPNYFTLGKSEDEEKSQKEMEAAGMDETKVLDLDDSAKDATLEGKEKEHIIEEIKGEEKNDGKGWEDGSKEEKKADVKDGSEGSKNDEKEDNETPVEPGGEVSVKTEDEGHDGKDVEQKVNECNGQ